MDEARKEALRVHFNRDLKLEFHGAALASMTAGLVTRLDLDEALTAMAEDLFSKPRRGQNAQHELTRTAASSRFVSQCASCLAVMP